MFVEVFDNQEPNPSSSTSPSLRAELDRSITGYTNAWTPLFGMEQLKPRVTSWVEEGLKRIRTPAMKATLIDAFKRDGRFAEIRSAVCQAVAASDLEKAKSVMALDELFKQEMTEEEEEDVQELDAGDDEGLELVCEGFAAVVV